MTSTAAISSQNRLAQSTNGRSDTDSTQGQDFIAALNRLAYASLSAAALPLDTSVPDTSRTPPTDDSAPEPEHTDREAGRIREPKDNDIPADAAERHPVRDEARPDDSTPRAGVEREATERPAATAATSNEATATSNEATATSNEAVATSNKSAAPSDIEEAATSLPTPFEQRGPQVAAAKQGAERPAANAAQTQPAQPANAEASDSKQPGPQATGRGPNTAQTQITAQVTDSGDGDRLPQIGHTLSSRSAIVAQSDTAKTGAPADAAAKNIPADAATASLLTGAAQPNGQAAKAKGQGKAANNGTPGNATATNGTQNAAAQGNQAQGNQAAAAQAQSAAGLPLQQAKLAATAAGTDDGLSAGAPQTGSAKSEPFTLAGTGPTASQFSPRGAAPAQAAKSPPPVPARFITNQVAVQIQKAFGDGGDRISIQLKPAELGRVEVHLTVGKEGHVAAVVTADRADTLDLLQRDARILQNALQDAGLQADGNSLSFELKSQDQAFTPSSGGAAGGGVADDGTLPGAAEATAALARQNIIAQDRIDIRV
jgi:flagellar hook-length control protein FliK